MTLVRDIGEQGLLQLLQRFCPKDVIGDDAAVLPFPPGQNLVVTTDVLVDGVHFSDRTTSPQDAGWRAVAANLSDLAAMGASPLGITVGLAVTGDLAVSWILQLYQGISDCLQQYNTPLVGGDICRSSVINIAITAFGHISPNRIIKRGAAKVGDAIVVTGIHGVSRAGLELLLNPEFGQNCSEVERQQLMQAHQRPKPRLDVLPILRHILDQSSIQIAGMDSSDGLADAVLQICRASDVGAILERTLIPLPSALRKLATSSLWDWVLYGGEDFELVLCLPPEAAAALVKQLGGTAAIIGKVTPGEAVWLRDASGNYQEEKLNLSQGFQHF
jgi:thiamine-monophosphate kinase